MNFFDLIYLLRETEKTLPEGVHFIESGLNKELMAPMFDLSGVEFRLRRLLEKDGETHARWVQIAVRKNTPREAVERNIASALEWLQASDEPGRLEYL